jgi:hypothetical protein
MIIKKIKLIILICLFIFVIPFASSLDLSAGLGLNYALNLSRTNMKIGGTKVYENYPVHTLIGGLTFFDCYYGSISAGLSDDICNDYSQKQSFGARFRLLGKYPFKIARISLFPLAGIEYRITTRAKSINSLWADVGGGVNYYISNNLYLGANILYSIRFYDIIDKQYNDKLFSKVGAYTIEQGPDISIFVGYRFHK